MATVHRFEDLEIWKLAREVYKDASLVAKRLRIAHEFRFSDQMKSSAGSAMDNIAEGFERSSRLEFINSLSISKGECGELKSQYYRCLDDEYISSEEFEQYYLRVDILVKKIAAFINYLNRSTTKGLKFKDRQT
jgi:four helix bundle protein